MSEKFKKVEKDLNEISELMDEVIENWKNLSDEEFYKLAKKYPEYLPSFDEFKYDFDNWVQSLSEKD